jgi:hypothetical protein
MMGGEDKAKGGTLFWGDCIMGSVGGEDRGCVVCGGACYGFVKVLVGGLS